MAKLTYKKIKNFLNETELNLLSTYCKLRCRFPSNENISWNNPDKPANFKFNFKSDTIMESLLLTKQKKVEEILGEKLWPTYSFWRPYFLGNDLSKHKDRSSCEISLSVCIEKDKINYPLYINDKPFHLEPGEAVLYEGTKYTHYRKKSEGDYCANVFIHYVRKDGTYKHFKYDKRINIGAK